MALKVFCLDLFLKETNFYHFTTRGRENKYPLIPGLANRIIFFLTRPASTIDCFNHPPSPFTSDFPLFQTCLRKPL